MFSRFGADMVDISGFYWFIPNKDIERVVDEKDRTVCFAEISLPKIGRKGRRFVPTSRLSAAAYFDTHPEAEIFRKSLLDYQLVQVSV